MSDNIGRRTFLKGAAMAGAAAAVGLPAVSCNGPVAYNLSRSQSRGSRMTLRFFPYELEMKHTFTVSGHSRKITPDVQVEIAYDGYVGYGEASMPQYLGHTVESVCAFLSKVDLSGFDDPFRLEDIMEYVNGLSQGDAPAKAAIDIALHDLTGKLLGQPLWRLWGLNPDKAPDTTFTIGIDTPEVVREKTLETSGRFNILKIKVGLPSDREMIRAIREVSSLPIAVDANQGWKDKSEALDTICFLAEQGAVMVEQPMAKERLDDIAWITERSPIPIFADESVQGPSDIPRLQGAFSGVNIKLMKCGGLLQAREMISCARALGMRAMIGCMVETSCAVSAASHLSPLTDFADLDGNLLITNDRFRTGVRVSDDSYRSDSHGGISSSDGGSIGTSGSGRSGRGHLILPTTPGIGVIPF